MYASSHDVHRPSLIGLSQAARVRGYAPAFARRGPGVRCLSSPSCRVRRDVSSSRDEGYPMDDSRFDRLTKRLAERRSRREVVRALVASALGGAVTVAGVESGLAKPPGPKPIVCPKGKPNLCNNSTCV